MAVYLVHMLSNSCMLVKMYMYMYIHVLVHEAQLAKERLSRTQYVSWASSECVVMCFAVHGISFTVDDTHVQMHTCIYACTRMHIHVHVRVHVYVLFKYFTT